MTQLTYNEAFDPYHAAFRLVRLHMACGITTRVPFETIRILDFYLLFPFRLQSMRFLDDDKSWRKVSKAYSDQAPYGMMPEDIVIFSRMEPFQRAAASSLVSSGYLVPEAWDQNEVQFTQEAIPDPLRLRCSELNNRMKDIVEILCQIRISYPLRGRNGLKDRTGLLEYRYDPI
ncbi:ABC-three component system middle component 5 [uncultured Agrobacterium sp.]|uniref:ABC-three component system middle component 5 n=1 Tax=uncultured Agrobacterium sp. TaxID=157277 RepID=UPI0025D4E87D|nr:ABC-three component system middle component 5 [uncultured Agrobacterium sp.]